MSIYFEHLAQDMSALGADGLSPHFPEQYRSVYKFMMKTGERFSNPQELMIDPVRKPTTSLGKTIMELINQDCGFVEMRWYRFCPDSEPRLLSNIADTGNSFRKQPVIVTSQNEPIAILKTAGDRTLYGLRTCPEFGIAAGCFSATETRAQFDPYELGQSIQPWKVEIEDIDAVYPTRPSMFTIPVRERVALQTDFAQEATVLRVSHAYIIRRAQELVELAVDLSETSA